ncbi:bis-aminopropyl spermidine synthase family protein [Actinokineospora guangxiensis]|uniref:Bis-aminopropyl spermidine synthase family protein n=1 Tax=Actinokineospora guangxiensis TaxID=1490288 RepID=A0ABW0EUC0_9PSEU
MSLTSFLAARGVHARAFHPIIGLLAADWQPLDELVRASALPRRTVEDLLACEDVESRDGRWRLAAPVPAIPERASLDGMATVLKNVPRPLRALDHVQADLATVRKRAEWLDDTYALTGAHLVCVGDHDLTALAACMARPTLRATVIDVDDRLLEYVDTVATSLGLPIRCLHADFRFGLPPAVAGTADLVFTDPPYTPEGMRLFLARAVQALRGPEGRVIAAYGYSKLAPTLGLKVQREILSLGLVTEAVLPAFNRYHGAQAVGSAADLYVLQPTSSTPTQATTPTAIYTHGPQSLEATTTAPEAVGALLAKSGATTLTPPDWTSPYPRGPLAFDLTPDPGPWLSRVLLAAPRTPVTALVANNHPDTTNQAAQESLKSLLANKFTLTFHRSTPTNKHAVITATPLPATTSAADLLNRPHGKLANIWREALIKHAPTPLTKRDARARVSTLAPNLTDERLIDLPRHQVAHVLTTAAE